jgi:hypothetical protein
MDRYLLYLYTINLTYPNSLFQLFVLLSNA